MTAILNSVSDMSVARLDPADEMSVRARLVHTGDFFRENGLEDLALLDLLFATHLERSGSQAPNSPLYKVLQELKSPTSDTCRLRDLDDNRGGEVAP